MAELSTGHQAPHIHYVNQPYVPLRVLSSFTMLEGAMEPKTIAERAAALGFPAIALTDRNGLYGAMPFSDACAAKGVQPIIGAMLGVARPPDMGAAAIDWLALLAKDEQGYANLCKLVSAAHLDRPISEEPHVPFDKLEGLNPLAVIAGHKIPENPDDPRIIGETRKYLRDFIALDEATTTARQLYDAMLELYPDRANPGSLWGAANTAKKQT